VSFLTILFELERRFDIVMFGDAIIIDGKGQEKDTWYFGRNPDRPNIDVPESLLKFKANLETVFHKCGVPIDIEDGFCLVNDDEPESVKRYTTDVQVFDKGNVNMIAGGSLGFCGGHPILILICINDTCSEPHTIMSTPFTDEFAKHFIH
jgi:hypothetical protein